MLTSYRLDKNDFLEIAIGEAVSSVLLHVPIDDPFIVARIYTAAKRKLIDEIRRRKRLVPFSQIDTHDQNSAIRIPNPEHLTLERLAIEQLIERLSPKQAEAVRLHYLEGHTVSEVGRILNISSDAAKARITAALRTLRALALHDERIIHKNS
ncbi:MAG: RNA polymerase sigma factor [Bacteroidetes bacterium]|nr:RNA polymerase sigma factor [Bacteroidota bacterium]